jgi:hypothetical protein
MFSTIDFESLVITQSDLDKYKGKTIESLRLSQVAEGTDFASAVRLRFTDGDYVLLGITWMIRR